MAKNIMPDIAKLLGVEIEEEFEIKIKNGCFVKNFDITITKNNILCKNAHIKEWKIWEDDGIYDLFNGSLEVVRKPFKPKRKERYWSYYFDNWQVTCTTWNDKILDYLRLKLGLCFRTEEEALQNRSRIYKELTGKEWKNE